MEQMNPFRKAEKSPSFAQLEAVKRAAEIANREKSERLAKEKNEQEETERLRRLMQEQTGKESGPHVITKFEKLN